MSTDAQKAEHAKNQVIARQVWRAWRTAYQMVQDRGYEISEDEVNISFDRFKAEYCDERDMPMTERLTFTARPSAAMLKKTTPPATAHNPNPVPDAGTVWVKFMEAESIGIKEIRSFVEDAGANNYKSGIMVTQAALSAQARKLITAATQYTRIECFLREDLLVNITHHELVPRHIVLSREEKAALLSRYRLKETQLPRILQRDPIARYYGLQRGQVVKIIRTSETAGRYASYRLCI